MKHAFNEKVLKLREQKLRVVAQIQQIGERLAEIRVEIPPKLVKRPPPVPVIDEDLEFPEKNLEVISPSFITGLSSLDNTLFYLISVKR